jgi:hypothetical protein
VNALKKILLITDVCLNKNYNAGIKNGVLSLINNITEIPDVELDILSFHYRRPSELDSLDAKYIWRPDFVNLIIRKIRSRLSINKPLLEYKNSKYKSSLVKALTKSNLYDICIVEYLENSFLLESISGDQTRKVCDIQDIMTHRKESFLSHGGSLPADENLDIDIVQELNAMAKFNAVLTIEDSESDFLKQNLRNEVILFKKFPVIPSNVKFNKVNENSRVINIGFLGGGANFNIDSINEFIQNVWNKGLYSENLKLVVAGAVCKGLVQKPRGNYHVLGLIDSVSTFYDSIDIAINPILYGSGLKMKNAETLLYGTPLITNELGGKGFTMINNDYCKIINMLDVDEIIIAIKKISSSMSDDVDFQTNCALEGRKYFSAGACFREFKKYILC